MPRNAIARLYGRYMFCFLKEIAKHFSKVAVPFYIPTSNVGEIQFLHVLTSIWYRCYFILAFLILVKWSLIMIVITLVNDVDLFIAIHRSSLVSLDVF